MENKWNSEVNFRLSHSQVFLSYASLSPHFSGHFPRPALLSHSFSWYRASISLITISTSKNCPPKKSRLHSWAWYGNAVSKEALEPLSFLLPLSCLFRGWGSPLASWTAFSTSLLFFSLVIFSLLNKHYAKLPDYYKSLIDHSLSKQNLFMQDTRFYKSLLCLPSNQDSLLISLNTWN